jgi:anti-sigma factor RsiW
VRVLLFALNGSHRETARHMSAFADGQLGGYRGWRVARHLARCEKCQALYRSFLATLAAVRELGRADPRPDEEFVSRLTERLRKESLDDGV